jgi:ABC-type sugar transport system ATPase subunit
MGSETCHHLAGHAHSFVARVPASHPARANQQLSLTFDLCQAHFFDPASSTSIV